MPWKIFLEILVLETKLVSTMSTMHTFFNFFCRNSWCLLSALSALTSEDKGPSSQQNPVSHYLCSRCSLFKTVMLCERAHVWAHSNTWIEATISTDTSTGITNARASFVCWGKLKSLKRLKVNFWARRLQILFPLVQVFIRTTRRTWLWWSVEQMLWFALFYVSRDKKNHDALI